VLKVVHLKRDKKNAMKVNMKVTTGNLEAGTPAKPSAKVNQTEIATDTFTKTSALDKSLAGVPDVRSDAVARAKALISDSSYPSAAVVKQLAGFMANKFSSVEP
jgi:hypothetical protein